MYVYWIYRYYFKVDDIKVQHRFGVDKCHENTILKSKKINK